MYPAHMNTHTHARTHTHTQGNSRASKRVLNWLRVKLVRENTAMTLKQNSLETAYVTSEHI